MLEVQIEKANLLFEQQRYSEAKTLLVEIINQDPNNIVALLLIAQCHIQEEHYNEAEEFIDNAIAIAPYESVLFRVKSQVYIGLEKYDKAIELLNEAISLDVEDADNYAMLASIKLTRKKFQEALELSEQALSLEPDNLLALNNRSYALLKLGKKEDSYNTIQQALNEDPHNSYTHANHGRGLLEKGEHVKALEHFKEALKIDPNSEIAQSGMAEAVKAKYFLYRMFLKYSFWMGNLSGKLQFGFIFGIWLAIRFLRKLSVSFPEVEKFILPITILLVAFTFSTWIVTPISNLFLRLNKYGKHLLDSEEIKSSNLVGVCLILFLTGLVLTLITNHSPWSVVGFYGFSMMIPCSSMFSKRNNYFLIYGIGLAIIGAVVIYKSFATGFIPYDFFTITYLIGFVAYSWLASMFGLKEANK